MEDASDSSTGRPLVVSHISTLAASIAAHPTEWKKKTPLKTYSKKSISSASPNLDPEVEGKSRYGRTRKLRPSGDFLSTDRKVSQYMKINYEDQLVNVRSMYSNSNKTSQSRPNKFGGPRSSLPARLPRLSGAGFANGRVSSEVIASPLDLAAPVSNETIEPPLPLQESECEDTDSEASSNSEYHIGDLVWAAVPGYPYWPAMITRDPVTNVTTKLHGERRKHWHVHFFGDRGFRGWVYSQNLFPFDLETYTNKKSEVMSVNESEIKRVSDKKSLKQQKKLYTIVERYQHSWNLAVSESQSLMDSPRNERLEYFAATYLTKKEAKMRSWSSNLSLANGTYRRGATGSANYTGKTNITPNKGPIKRMRSWSSTLSLATDENKPKRRKSDVPTLLPLAFPGGTAVDRANASPFKLPTRIASKSQSKALLMARSKIVVESIPARQRVVSAQPVTEDAVSPVVTDPILVAPVNSPSKKHSSPVKDTLPQKKPRVSRKTLFGGEATPVADIKSEPKELLSAASFPTQQQMVESSPAETTPESTMIKRGRSWKNSRRESDTDSNTSQSLSARQNHGASPRQKKKKRKESHEASANVYESPVNAPVESIPYAEVSSNIKKEKDNTVSPDPPASSPLPTVTRSGRKSVKPELLKPTFKKDRKPATPKAGSPPPIVVKKEPVSPNVENTAEGKKLKKKKSSHEEVPPSENSDLSKPSAKTEVAPKVLPKKASLFAGVKDVKVCSICFKGVKVVRCRGPCSLYMHVECGEKPRFVPVADPRESDSSARRKSKKKLGRGLKRREIKCESDDNGSLNDSIKEEVPGSDLEANLTKVLETSDRLSGENHSESTRDVPSRRDEETDHCRADYMIMNGFHNDPVNGERVKSGNQLSESTSSGAADGPSSSNQTNGPCSPKLSNGPSSPEQTNGPLSPEQSNRPVIPEQSNGPPSPKQSNAPPSPEGNSASSSCQQTNGSSSPELTNGPTNPDGANRFSSPEQTNGSLSPERTDDPSSLEPVLEMREKMANHITLNNNKMFAEKPIKSCKSDDEDSLLHDSRDSFPNSSAIPTPPPEESGNSPVRDGPRLMNCDKGDNLEKMEVDVACEKTEVDPTTFDVVDKTVEVVVQLPPELNSERLDTAESTTSDSSEKDKNGCASSKKDAKEKGWMCSLCVNNLLGPCFACGKDDGDRVRCKSAVCGKVFHLECMKEWPQHSLKQNAKGKMVFHCPAHTCHTCISDNPSCLTSRYLNDKLVRCMKCPTTYHHGNHCVPAGSEILTSTQIICPRHFRLGRKSLTHLNASWCFLCSTGGSLICCDLCPTAFHVECLKISPPEGAYICEDCETGRFPLYGEIVWVKLGFYRWWPARILFPQEIPPRLLKVEHVPGEFAVRFYGTYDYYWVNRGRVFLFHEGDGKKQESMSTINNSKKAKDEAFHKGVREANEDFIIWNEKRNHLEESHRPTMKPPKYTKITSNKPVGSVKMTEADASSLTACECSPDLKDPCGPDSDCINRLLLVECDPETCPAQDKCKNRNFEKRLYPPLVAFRTESRGWGLKTLGPLKKGDFIIEYVGEMIDEEEYRRRLQEMQKNKDQNFYFLTLDKDRMLDAGPKGNLARFMNHSCQPNCETQKWTVEGNTRVGLFALQDIPADTELVFNYNLMTTGDNKIECRCGAPNCAGYIGGKPTKPQNKPKDDANNKPQHGRQNKFKKKRKSKKANKNLTKIALTNSSLNASSKSDTPKCSMCNENGATIACQESQCTKMYHLACTHLTKEPKHYTCLSHECSTCSSRNRVENCSLCINSYCSEHQEGNMVINREKGPLCRNCYESDSGSEWSTGGKDEETMEPPSTANGTRE